MACETPNPGSFQIFVQVSEGQAVPLPVHLPLPRAFFPCHGWHLDSLTRLPMSAQWGAVGLAVCSAFWKGFVSFCESPSQNLQQQLLLQRKLLGWQSDHTSHTCYMKKKSLFEINVRSF